MPIAGTTTLLTYHFHFPFRTVNHGKRDVFFYTLARTVVGVSSAFKAAGKKRNRVEHLDPQHLFCFRGGACRHPKWRHALNSDISGALRLCDRSRRTRLDPRASLCRLTTHSWALLAEAGKIHGHSFRTVVLSFFEAQSGRVDRR